MEGADKIAQQYDADVVLRAATSPLHCGCRIRCRDSDATDQLNTVCLSTLSPVTGQSSPTLRPSSSYSRHSRPSRTAAQHSAASQPASQPASCVLLCAMSAGPLPSASAGDGLRVHVMPHSPKRPTVATGAAAAALHSPTSASSASAASTAASATSAAHSSPRFFDPSVSLSSLPPSLLTHYSTHRSELDLFDAAIRRKAASMVGKLHNIDVVVGIPFYTEITNIISVLVTLKQVFRQRRQPALLLVIGEFARSDMVEQIPLHQLEDDEDEMEEECGVEESEECDRQYEERLTAVHIESFWKPHPKYASKPFTVRALQVMADRANGGRGAHLIIMDADIQFNHWELSAMSLMRALLDPLMALNSKDQQSQTEDERRSGSLEQSHTQSSEQSDSGDAGASGVAATASDGSVASSVRTRSLSNGTSFHPQFPLRDLDRPPAASFVLLNAPRSFIADDALVHLFSYLLTFSYTGQHIHQSHGGEFSIHKQLNRSLLQDESIVYRHCYCVEAQMVCRALLEPTPTASSPVGEQHQYGGYVLEMLMKGKWHAKINLDKLLQLDSSNNARLDLVSEKIFTDALLFASLQLCTTAGRVHLRTGGLTKTPNPDPNQQSVAVLCPIATKKEMLRAVKQYYLQLLAAQADGSLPIDSSIVQELIPQLHSKLAKLPGDKGWNHVVTALPAHTAHTGHLAVGSHLTRNTSSSLSRSGSSPHVKRAVSDEQLLVFGCEEWSRYTMELLRVFRDATLTATPTDDKQRARDSSRRQAALTANRVVWLLGTLAFLNQHSHGSWGDMHVAMHSTYAPVFRRRFLTDICGIDSEEADRVSQHDARMQPT